MYTSRVPIRRAHTSTRIAALPETPRDDDGGMSARARLDAIAAADEGLVEDPGERGTSDMFSGGVFTPEVGRIRGASWHPAM
jgi:hypothetical protein